MARDFQKAERRLKKDEKYKLLSYATSSESVEMTDGTDLQTKMNSVDKSISDEVTRAKGAESTLTTNLNSEISRATTKENEIASNLSSHTGNKSNPHSVTKAQVGLGNVENKSSATIRGEITKSNVTTALGYTPYTPNEVDNKLSALETNIDWKESVATYADIATTYPKPVDGWTVNVKDTDYTYRYNGTSWVVISANAIPKATNSVDGLLSKEDHINYEDANSKKHTHSNKSVLDGISSTNISNWNAAKTHADSAHAPSNAQANQNAFSNIAIGSTTIAADTTTDTLTLTGSNVTLTPDATNDKVTIGITKENIVSALGYTPGSSVDNDTKNTAGSTDTSSKIFLVGATSQAANPQTYSDNQVYAQNGQLNGNSVRVAEKVTLQYNASTESIDFVFA